MSARATYTSVAVRAKDLVAGEVALVGGLCFTRLSDSHALTKHSVRQKARYVEVLSVRDNAGWVEVKFRGGDSPANDREMFALFRPFEVVRVQVEREG